MTIEQVQALWAEQFAKVKPFLKEGVLAANAKGELPDLWPGYAQASEQRRGILPHVMPGPYPEHLFAQRTPNQTEKEQNWLRLNFKQVTMPVYLDLENTVGRAMHKRNWALEFDDDTMSAEVRDFVEGGVTEWGALFNFFRFAGTKIKICDPMGCLAFVPSEIAVVEKEVDNGERIQMRDPDAEIRPDIHYFECDRLWGFKYDKWYLLRLDANSMTEWGAQKRANGVVCWFIDEEAVWQITQVGRQSDYTFEFREYYRHNLGYPPCINWMGTPSVKRSRLIWESPYLAVKDVLDIALVGEHWLRASEAKCVYPHMVVVGSPCSFVDREHSAVCDRGTIHWTEEGGIQRERKCTNCGGTGWETRLSPLGQVVINPDSSTTTSDSVNATNALAFVSPPTDTVKYLQEQFDNRMRLARSIMHLDAEQPMDGGEAKTATEAGLNARAKDAFVKPIADQLFTIFEFAIKCIGEQIAGAGWEGFTLRAPTHYDLRTDNDHLEELANAMDKGLPPAVTSSLVWEYLTNRYQSDPEALAAFDVIIKADRLMGMDKMLIQADTAAGRVQPWESLIHFAGLMLYEKARMENGWDALDIAGRIDRIKALAKIEAPGMTAQGGPLLRLASAVAA